MELSKSLAGFIKGTDYHDLPQDVVEFTKLCILDWLGSALAGKEKVPIKKISDLVEEMGGNPQATTVNGKITSVAQAAFVNGASSHVVELDDIHKASIIHAATVVIPAALAVSEWKEKNGKDLITAVVVGYEVCYRIGEAVSPSHYYYWHNTATCGTFGAAAAVAKLLDLEVGQIVHALGSAGTQAAGLWEFIEDGAMSKQLHPGKAAYNGTISALLAQKDFTSAKKILEGDRGFFKAMSDCYDSKKITHRLGEVFKITENSFKVHASCRHTHAAVDMVLEMLNEHGLHEDIVSNIQIRTYKTALDITDNLNPDTVYTSKFSIQFCVALALLRGKVALSDFDERSLHDQEIREVMKHINVSIEPVIESQYPEKWGAEVEFSLIDGKSIKKRTEYPKGDPENPVTEEDLIIKFKDLAYPSLKDQTQRVIDYLLRLDEVQQLEVFKHLETV
ncbi:MmgE/PrpD family protein [Pseudalkalibacillus decolorationis]|uniref:MmgE/PrpD family protein n=1 Tax=Pseudalkalibacillus decolorationis TaxID=163879 RepID=UPI0021495A8B|nr:MmgE/PrpD family protein [Pseudalkalibacillus decolorationis]